MQQFIAASACAADTRFNRAFAHPAHSGHRRNFFDIAQQ